MSLPAPPDDTLREFLLGTLSADQADIVREWLDADPANAVWLARLSVRDPLTDAVSDSTPYPVVPADAVERILRGVSGSWLANGDTPALTDGTVPRLPTTASPQPATTTQPYAEAPPWLPQRLGQFRIIRELGHGGMGYVFEAEDETLGRRVAVKVLTPELARLPEAVARFLREARSAAAIKHDNVVPVLHVGQVPSTKPEGVADTPYIVMPLLQGESLGDRLKRSTSLSVAEVQRVGRDIAAGLTAAHAKGLVHRDLKPANVWLDTDTGRAVVLDFGLARHGDGSDAMTQSGSLAGTPAYMGPELLDGKPATAQSDLFALGAVLYECVTGRRAFDGPSITAILKAVSEYDPPAPAALNPAIPAGLSSLIVRLLAKKPADRPASAEEVLTALARPDAVPDLVSQPTRTWPEVPKPARTGRAPRQLQIGCVITISLCLMIGVGVFAMQSRNRDRELAQQPVANNDQPKWSRGDPPKTGKDPGPILPPVVKYSGKVDVLLARTQNDPLMRLNVAGALPMRQSDTFRIEAEVNAPAYLYLIWVDPDHDITPVYPWNPKEGWGSRPATEMPQSSLKLPLDPGKRYTAPMAKPGVATMVLFACEKPLTATDAEIEKWFKDLPELPLPNNRDDGVMWFDNYAPTTDPLRALFGEVDADKFGQWQGKLKSALARREVFQTAVSFARTGKK